MQLLNKFEGTISNKRVVTLNLYADFDDMGNPRFNCDSSTDGRICSPSIEELIYRWIGSEISIFDENAYGERSKTLRELGALLALVPDSKIFTIVYTTYLDEDHYAEEEADEMDRFTVFYGHNVGPYNGWEFDVVSGNTLKEAFEDMIEDLEFVS